MKNKIKNIVILDNIRSAENVGSIFRTADAFGVDKVYLVGITPLPVDRFGRVNKKISKASLGAENFVSWESKKDMISLIKKLKKEGYLIVAIEQAKNSVNYKKFKSNKDKAFILGREVEGVSERVLKECDSIVEIPMKGKKESLNVSVSFGVVISSFVD